MVIARKIIPFALAAGMASAVAADDKAAPAAGGDPFDCVRVEFMSNSGRTYATVACPNVAGDVLVGRHAMTEMDWERAYDGFKSAMDAGVRDVGLAEKLVQSAVMTGDRDKVMAAAEIARDYDMTTPHGALARAVEAAAQEDTPAMQAALQSVIPVRGDRAGFFVERLGMAVAVNAVIGEDLGAEEILWNSAEEAHRSITDMTIEMSARRPEHTAFYKTYADEAALMRSVTELAIVPDFPAALRAMAQAYEQMGVKEAARRALGRLAEDDLTMEDLTLKRRLEAPPMALQGMKP